MCIINTRLDLIGKEYQFKLSGNGVYYKACSSLVIVNHSCSKLQYQRVSTSFPFDIKSERVPEPGCRAGGLIS